MRRYIPAVALGFILTSCVSATNVGHLPSPSTTMTAISSEMLTAAQRENERILASYGGIYDNPRLQASIEKIIVRLAEASDRPGLKYQVTILNSPAINAFSLPTGQLYVTRGLIALTNDEAELASVLAHEIGHVVAQHAAIREEQAKQAAIVNLVVNEVLSDPEAGALALAKSRLALASFSRAQEIEADELGIHIAARAGYDPLGASRFLTNMQRNADVKSPARHSALGDFLSNHPATPDRIQNALANARQLSGQGGGREQDPAPYLSNLDGVIYGDDVNNGFIRGRHFVHPKFAVSFTLPDGFTVTHTGKTVLGINADGTQALRVNMVDAPAGRDLADFLKSEPVDKADNIDPEGFETFTINGLQAAAVTAKGKQWFYWVYAIGSGDQVYRFLFAAKEHSEAADHSFRKAVKSFRKLNQAERNHVKLRRLKIVEVKAGDTPEKLARRMATADHPLELFRVLNGLNSQDGLKPGQPVKIIVN